MLNKPPMRTTLKIGTRGSPLALTQTRLVEAALKAAHPQLHIEIVIIRTSGDWKPEDGETRLAETQGGKGLFAREIEKALLDGAIDCAVHSMKDMPSFLPDGLMIEHVLKRNDPRDAFISFNVPHYNDLPQGAVVGTSSLRRQALLLSDRPDLKIVPLRGNVQTRIDKLKDGQVDATFLAMAGLNRLNLSGDYIHAIETDDMLPACTQGIIGIECRTDDKTVHGYLDPIHDVETGYACAIERAALQILDGSCHTPIGAYARKEGDEFFFELKVASADGQQVFERSASAKIASDKDAADFGAAIGALLKQEMPADFLT